MLIFSLPVCLCLSSCLHLTLSLAHVFSLFCLCILLRVSLMSFNSVCHFILSDYLCFFPCQWPSDCLCLVYSSNLTLSVFRVPFQMSPFFFLRLTLLLFFVFRCQTVSILAAAFILELVRFLCQFSLFSGLSMWFWAYIVHFPTLSLLLWLPLLYCLWLFIEHFFTVLVLINQESLTSVLRPRPRPGFSFLGRKTIPPPNYSGTADSAFSTGFELSSSRIIFSISKFYFSPKQDLGLFLWWWFLVG
jgi:hypothetical protein